MSPQKVICIWRGLFWVNPASISKITVETKFLVAVFRVNQQNKSEAESPLDKVIAVLILTHFVSTKGLYNNNNNIIYLPSSKAQYTGLI